MNQHVSGYEYLVVGIYFVFMLMIGFVFRRFSSNASDYFRSGGRGTWWLVGMSAFISGISAYTFTGAAGVVFEAGWSVTWIYLGNALSFLLAFLFTAAWFRRLRVITLAQVIRIRFGAVTQQIYAWYNVALFVLMGGAMGLYALAIFTSSVFGFNVYAVICVLGLVVLIYDTAGGRWAVMAADFLQGVIVMVVTISLAVLVLVKVGGFGELMKLVHENTKPGDMSWIKSAGQFSANRYTLAWAIALAVKQGLYGASLATAPRYLSAKDDRHARNAALLAMCLMFVGCFFWFIPPLYAKAVCPEIVEAMKLSKPGESSYAVASLQLLPTGMVGLMVASMFAATMSSLDAALNNNAGILVCDVIPALRRKLGFHKELSDKIQLRLSRAATVVMGLICIATAASFASIQGLGMFELVLAVGTLLGLPMLIPLVLGLFVKRVPWWSALLSIGTGLISSITGYCYHWNFQTQVMVNLASGSIGFFSTMFFYRETDTQSAELARETFRLIHTPVDFEKEIGNPNDDQQFKTVGFFITATGIMVLTMLLVPNALSGRIIISVMGGLILGTGLLLHYLGRRAAARMHKTPQPPAAPATDN